MRVGTGAKRRVIRAFDANGSMPFLFNRSINPRGGTLAKMQVHTSQGNHGRVKIFQDTNSDGKVSSKELIFHGKTRESYSKDELINFSGTAYLKKTMHRCDWLSMKFTDEQLMCTREYIPTTYDLKLIANSGDRYVFSGIEQFQDSTFK